MRVEAIQKSIRYFLSTGELVLLKPGQPVHLPESAIADLRMRAPAYIRLLSEVDDGPALDPADADPPIKPGWMIAFFNDRKYHGGITGGHVGHVARVTFDGTQWNFYTAGDWLITGRQVYQVWPVDRDGSVGEPWYVKARGLDGRGYGYVTTPARLSRAGVRVDAVDTLFANVPDPLPVLADTPRRRLSDVSPEQQTCIQRAFRLSPPVFRSLSTGEWPSETWDAFWNPARPGDHAALTPPGARPCRGSIAIDTAQGTREVRAWIIGPLAVHRSWNIAGWSVTHTPSGKKVLSRIASKDEALRLIDRLLPAIDWSVATPSPADLERIRPLLAQGPRIPLKTTLRDPFTLSPKKEA